MGFLILYINSLSQSVSSYVEILKPRSLLIKLSPWIRRPKNYLQPQVLTSYFYFYVRFRAATAGGPYFLLLRPFSRSNCRRSLFFTFTSVFAQQLPEVLTSYFYFYVRFRAATAGGPYFLLLLLRLFSRSNRRWGRYFWDLEGGWGDLGALFLG